MGAKSAGARTGLASSRLCLMVGAALLLLSCTGESSASDLVPTPGPSATVEVVPTSTPVATATPRQTATPTPTATAAPDPTATPTGVELYGPLLVEGAYTWPVEMPDDLTEDELFAINIFASAQNASFAAIEAQSTDLAEFDPLRDFVAEVILGNVRRAIALDIKSDLKQRFPVDGLTDLISVTLVEEQDSRLLLRTCEYIDSIFVLDDGSETDGENFTVLRDIELARTGEGLIYDAWKVVTSTDGATPACNA